MSTSYPPGFVRLLRTRLSRLTLSALALAALTVAGSTVAGSPAQAAPLITAGSATAEGGSYVVVLKDGAALERSIQRSRRAGAQVQRRFQYALSAYSAQLSAAELDTVRSDPAVQYVQENRTYRASTTQRLDPDSDSWGLDRIDEKSLATPNSYYYSATGQGVSAYVVDTGILAAHPDFGSRVRDGFTAISDGNGTNDCDGRDTGTPNGANPDQGEGHGTHVAGTIGGTRSGVAKGVSLVPVRVLNCDGEGSTETLLAGLNWIKANRSGPAVVNLSLESAGDTDPAIDAAVKSLIAAGIPVVIAAGNGDAKGVGQSACKVSPADVRAAITVGASDKRNRRASFSNYGACVDLYAPGVSIISDYVQVPINGRYTHAVAIETGTSMAAPHVTGAAAMYLQRNPSATPAQVSAALVSAAAAKKVTNISTGAGALLFAVQPAILPPAAPAGNRLRPGVGLRSNQRLVSANNRYRLGFSSGRLALTRSDGTLIWRSGAGNGSYATLSTAGRLGQYNRYGQLVWSSGSSGGRATLFVHSSGYLVILRDSDGKVLWRSN